MSWLLPKVFSDYWRPQPLDPQLEEEDFILIDNTLEESLAEAITSHLPLEDEKFKTAIANHFNLTLMSELGERGPTKAWLTTLTKQNFSKQTMALRITRVEAFRDTETKETFFLLIEDIYLE